MAFTLVVPLQYLRACPTGPNSPNNPDNGGGENSDDSGGGGNGNGGLPGDPNNNGGGGGGNGGGGNGGDGNGAPCDRPCCEGGANSGGGGTNGGGSNGGDDGAGGTSDTEETSDPIQLRYGAAIERADDLHLPAPGMSWTGSRSYASNGVGATTLGNKWLSRVNDMYLTQQGTNISLLSSASSSRLFTFNSGTGTYTSPPDSYLVLTADSANHRFIITDKTRNKRWLFNDFSVANTALRGKKTEETTLQLSAQSLSGNTYSYNTNGTVSQITTSAGQDYVISFTYSSTLITQIQVKDASGNLLQQVNYTYYQNVTSPSADIGTTNDLVQVRVALKATTDTAGTLSITRYTQYRYSTGSMLKAVYEHDAVQRTMSALSLATPEAVMTKGDTFGTPQVKTFASRSFTYYASNANTASINTPFATGENLNTTYGGSNIDETGYVATETVNGCGSCATAGSITKSYFYSGLNTTATDQNIVAQLVVEDTQDSAGVAVYRNVYGLENSGRKLRKAFIQNPTSSPIYWCESWTMSTSGLAYRTAEYRKPSAHTGVTTAANLRTYLNPYNGTSWANDTSTVNSSSGMIETYSYNSNGMLTDAFVKNGSSGTAYYVGAVDFGDSVNISLVTARYDYPTQTTTRSNGKQTSYSFTFYDSSTHRQIKTKTATLTAIPTTQNGSGVATTKASYYDNLGRLRWTQDGEGYINYISYNPITGSEAYSAFDVNPASPGSDITSGSAGNWEAVSAAGASSNQPTRNSSLPATLALATKTYYNASGWKTQVTDRSGASHYIAYSNSQKIHFNFWNSSTSRSQAPILVSNFNPGLQVTDSIAIRASYTAISTSSGSPTGFSTNPSQNDYVSWTHNTYDSVGRLSYVDNYANVPASGSGTLGTDFYRYIVQYDTQGRVQYRIQVIRGSASSNRVEQVAQNVYDIRGRLVQINTGVSGDTAANSQDMTDNYNSYPTLYARSQAIYDNGGVGDGYVTKTKRFYGTSSTAYSGSNLYRTYRGDLRGQEPFYVSGSTETAVGPYVVQDVDWKGRATTTAIFDADPSWSTVLTGDGYSGYASSTVSHRRMQSDALYDDLGRVYQIKDYEISSSTGSSTGYIAKESYYNRNDRLVAAANDHAAGTEIAYDGAGRFYQRRTVISLQSTPYSSGSYNYSAPTPNPTLSSMSGGDAGALTLIHRVLDANGNATEIDTFEDNHDDIAGSSPGINLTTNNDYVRRTGFVWYDSVGRLTTTADFGSGDTATGAGQWKNSILPTRPSTAPTASSTTALVTVHGYNADSGLHELFTDPVGTPNKTFFDRLGRISYSDQNYSSFNASTGTGTGNPTDVVIQRVYDGPNRLQKLVKLDPNGDGNQSDNQVTTYLYEDPVDATRNTSQIYPDSSDTTSSGTNQVKLAYNVDGTPNQRSDQRGTVIAYNYTNTRFVANQSVSTLGTGVDGAVRSIAYTYDNLNRKQNVTSYASTAGTGSVVNDVQWAYNDSNQVVTAYQSHSGAVNTSSTPNVQYTYDATLAGSIFSSQHRWQTLVYPNGRTIYYDYGTSTSAHNALSKIRTIWDTNTSGTALATYDYNGAGSRLAMVTLPQPSLRLNLFQGTSGTYAGLDRFGRVSDQYWQGFGATANADRIHYAYDYSGNRIYRDIDAAIYSTNNMDQAFTFDALHRLTTLQQGTLSGTTISGTATKEEDWTLDGVGNWPNYVAKTSGTATLNQSRTSNSANEITGISATVGSTWVTPAYDAAGNMTTIPQPATPTTGYTATYDAWNRLVNLVDSTTSQTVQQNQYDGRNYRVLALSYASGTLSETRHSYFTDDWRCVEERVGSASTADRQFVWGGRYIDDLVLRDRGAERFYALQDANWNVSAIATSAGVVQERYSYTGFGFPTFLSAAFVPGTGSSYSWEALFSGYRFDTRSGFYLVRNRIYQPQIGAWCQRDPLAYVDGMNLYSYVGGKTLLASDPSGLQQQGGEDPCPPLGPDGSNGPRDPSVVFGPIPVGEGNITGNAGFSPGGILSGSTTFSSDLGSLTAGVNSNGFFGQLTANGPNSSLTAGYGATGPFGSSMLSLGNTTFNTNLGPNGFTESITATFTGGSISTNFGTGILDAAVSGTYNNLTVTAGYGNNGFSISGDFTFNNGNLGINYNSNGTISGNGTLQIGNNVTLSGTLSEQNGSVTGTVNGTIIFPLRFKTR